MLKGKGMFIWKIKLCEEGNISNIVTMCQNAKFSHVLIKIADGTHGYNYTAEDGDMAKALVDALKEVNIEPWGWQYIYGEDPVGEALTANRRIEDTGIVGFVINAEGEIKNVANNDVVVSTYFSNLNYFDAIALSSYRYPEIHHKFPWETFDKYMVGNNDFIMPQVYWKEAHDPAVQLRECLRQYAKITNLPILPTGSAYCAGGWCPTNEEIEEFACEALGLGLPGINFWEWKATRAGGFWKTVRDIDYSTSEPEIPISCEELQKQIGVDYNVDLPLEDDVSALRASMELTVNNTKTNTDNIDSFDGKIDSLKIEVKSVKTISDNNHTILGETRIHIGELEDKLEDTNLKLVQLERAMGNMATEVGTTTKAFKELKKETSSEFEKVWLQIKSHATELNVLRLRLSIYEFFKKLFGRD